MSIIDKAFDYFKKDIEPVREAAGVSIDDDDDQWRPLSGDGRRDIAPMTGRRMRDCAVHLWESNLLANRLIELPNAYLLAEGVEIKVNDEDAQEWVNAFWNDPINNMDIKLPKKVRELALFGEQCWPAFTNEHNGHVRLGYLDPGNIETIVTDPDNIEQPIGVVTVADKKGNKRRYRIIVNGPESIFTRRTQAIRDTFDDGECFYFTINALSNGRRGRSDLLPQIDWLDAYDHFMFGELDRADFLRAFIWDVEMKGLDEEQIKERVKKMQPPAPGSIRAHNESETWKAETPGLGSGDTESIARLFRNHVMGGATIPEHWFGGGGDVNRATGESMSEPTLKMCTMRQREIKHILESLTMFQINRRLDPSGQSTLDPSEHDADLKPSAVFPEMSAKDTTKYAAALQQVVVAAGLAVERGFITDLMALKIIQSVSERLGVEMDAVEELKLAREEASLRDEQDVFTGTKDEELDDDEE
tara:strand:- start:2195 stop:3616 length:1422 start_codon:yes stop_codon:yes gene_type:complete